MDFRIAMFKIRNINKIQEPFNKVFLNNLKNTEI